VILQTLERGAVELGITDDMSSRIDERDAVTCRDTCFIRQGVRVYSWSPFGRKESCLTRQVVCGLFGNAGVDLAIDNDYDGHDHDSDDRERLEKQSLG
jgi:hypothetical protein